MKEKDIENLKNILVDLEDAENEAIINLSQEEINSLESILEYLKSSITYDIVRNDYCEKMLNQLLEENNEKSDPL